MKAALAFVNALNDISMRRHKLWYGHLFATIVLRQMRRWGDLWRFSTRSVEGRGGRLKHIGRRMLCWRRRSAKYRRTVKAKGGGSRVIEQSYTSTPERQLMRAACSREDCGHTHRRGRGSRRPGATPSSASSPSSRRRRCRCWAVRSSPSSSRRCASPPGAVPPPTGAHRGRGQVGCG